MISNRLQSLLGGPFFRSFSSLLAANSVSTVLGVVQGLVAARILGVEQFGILALITSFTVAVNQIVDSRTWETAIQFIIKYRAASQPVKARAIIKLCYLVDLLTAICAFGIVFLAAGWAARTFAKTPDAAGLYQLYAVTLLISFPMGTSSAVLRVAKRFNWLAYQQITTALVRLVGTVLALALGFGLGGVVCAYVVASTVATSILLACASTTLGEIGCAAPHRARLRVLRGSFREVFGFALASNSVALLKLFQNQADALFIGLFLGPAPVGLYRLAKRLCSLMLFPIAPMSVVAYPEFTRLWHERAIDELRGKFKHLTTALILAAVLMSAGLIAIAPTLIVWTAGPEFLPSLPIVYWLTFGTSLAVALNLPPILLRAAGRMRMALIPVLLAVIAQVICLVNLLPRYGLAGAGLAHLIFHLVWAVTLIVILAILWNVGLRRSAEDVEMDAVDPSLDGRRLPSHVASS